MSTIIHDLRCMQCGVVQVNVAIESGNTSVSCPLCAGPTQISWAHGKPPATDVYGQARYNLGTGREETSSRGAEKYMQGLGYDGHAGDRVHGGRVEHRIVGTGYSYSGQGSRQSTAERAKA